MGKLSSKSSTNSWPPTEPPTYIITQNRLMIYFYESHEDLAMRGGGVLSGGTKAKWYDDVTTTSGMDIADYIEATYNGASNDDQEQEYRDERDDSSRLADRHGCWCNNTARDITCACTYTALYITCVRTRSIRSKYTAHTQCITQHISRITQYIHTYNNTLRRHPPTQCILMYYNGSAPSYKDAAAGLRISP